MRDLSWMRQVGGEEPAVPASVLALGNGRRVAVAASRYVFLGVRLEEGEDPGFPAFEDRKSEKSRKYVGTFLRGWLTGEFAVATIPLAQLREWIGVEGKRYGAIGTTRYDRTLVDTAIAHAPPAETVTIGFDDGHGSLVLTFDGFRVVVAPALETSNTAGGPLLALPERVGAT